MAKSQAVSPAFRQGEQSKLARELVTPEGIPLTFTLAGAGDRAAGFLLDVLIQFGVIALIGLAMSFAGAAATVLRSIEIVLAFLIVNFYFAFFEVRWQGQTPGKRRIGIRVIDARGGQLETSAVLARNLVRELEIWTPLRFLILNRMLWPDAPTWALLLAMAWTFVFMLMPLFNKDKLQASATSLAGTRVVMQLKVVLVPDLVSQAATSMQMRAQAAPTFTFTEAQLSIYGIYELQVFEGVLRQDPDTLCPLRGALDGHRQDPRQDRLQGTQASRTATASSKTSTSRYVHTLEQRHAASASARPIYTLGSSRVRRILGVRVRR